MLSYPTPKSIEVLIPIEDDQSWTMKAVFENNGRCDSNLLVCPELRLMPLGNKAIHETSIEIFPNPNTGQFSIRGVDGETRVRIFDALGALIWEEKITTSSAQIQINLSTGINNVICQNEDRISRTKISVCP